MLVKIEEIKESGLVLDEAIPPKLLTEAIEAGGKADDFRPSGGFRLKAKLTKVSGSVLLKGEFLLRVLAPCKRCIVDVPLEVPVAFNLTLIPNNVPKKRDEEDEEAESEGSFDLEDAETEPFDGKTIDLDPILREQVLLALPISVVCREDCKGLCLVCGQNLNDKECGCERKVPDPRLAALKNIKLNQPKN
jgi:uncharacterized protein